LFASSSVFICGTKLVLGNPYRRFSGTNLWYLVVLQAKGRFVNRPTSTGEKKYDKFFVYVPTELAKDSQFPFKVGEEVVMTVKSNKALEVRKVKQLPAGRSD